MNPPINRVLGSLAFLLAGYAGATETVTFSNPETLAPPPGYSHVVEVNGPHRTVYIAGQLGLDINGRMAGEPGDFRAQATQAYENLKAALESVGASFSDIVKLNQYVTDVSYLPILREVRDHYFNMAAPPATTTVTVAALALPQALFEAEAVVILPLAQD